MTHPEEPTVSERQTPEYAKWFADLISIAPEYADTVYDDWACYFEDGYTPQQAIDEDYSHG